MKLYLNGSEQEKTGGHVIAVARENDKDGNPINEYVHFVDGVSPDVDEQLAAKLIDLKLASKTDKPSAPKADK